MRRKVGTVVLATCAVLAGLAALPSPHAGANPLIQHVIIIDEENHTFDDIFGKFCLELAAGRITRSGVNDPCSGANHAVLSTGTTYQLPQEPDFGLRLDHSVSGQHRAVDGGAMDRFDTLTGCRSRSAPAFGCLSQFDPLNGTCGVSGTKNCLPNVDSYATAFAISDDTFEFRQTPSWAGHMILASASIEHFKGLNPLKGPDDPGGAPGWGCDSGKSTPWYLSGNRGPTVNIPSCIPDRSGSLGSVWSGYDGVQADYVPTIFDRMDRAGVSWKIYKGAKTGGGSVPVNGWSICPTFQECQGSPQALHVVSNTTFPTDVADGDLPAVSFVVPGAGESAHQPASASSGDAWVGSVVSAVMNSPEWSSTAIFITYDDCGCFYDHVNPLQYSADWGIRVPHDHRESVRQGRLHRSHPSDVRVHAHVHRTHLRSATTRTLRVGGFLGSELHG